MQTTLRIDDHLYRQAKARAASLGISLTRLLEDALREHLHAPEPQESQPSRLPVSSVGGGLLPPFSSLKEAVAAADLERDRRGAR